VVALSILIFTATASVLSGLQNAPAAFAASEGFVISSVTAPTIFSSQVDMGMVSALESVGNITGVSPEVFAFSTWDHRSFVVRGVDLVRLNATGPALSSLSLAEGASATAIHSALVGSRLLERLSVELPFKMPLVGSYQSRIELVDVVGSFTSDSPLDDEMLVSLEVARFLSGTPDDRASIIRVSTSEPEWLSALLSPESARFALYDLHLSRGTVAAWETLTATMTLRNWGMSTGTATVEVSDGGVPVDVFEVVLNASESRTVSRELTFPDLGQHEVRVSLLGDFPVRLAASVDVVEPYMVLIAPSKALLGEGFGVRLTSYSGEPIEGASVTCGAAVSITDASGSATVSSDVSGSVPVTASHEGYDDVSRSVEIVDLGELPPEFLPEVTSLSVSPSTFSESESTTASVVVENMGSVAGTFEVMLLLDSGDHADEGVALAPAGSATVTFALESLSPGTHIVQVGAFSVEIRVDPWFVDDSDLVQLVVRYGGSSTLSSASSLPLYQAAKISEGNVAVALLSVGAVSAVLVTLAISSVFSKEVHEGRHRLGVMRTLGASRSHIRRLVFPQALLTSLVGAAVGIAFGVAAARTLSELGVFVVFGHQAELALDLPLLVVVLLGAVAISIVSALLSSEAAVRETAISSIRRLEAEPGPEVDIEALLGDE
jgi:hypothetical protein